MPNTSSGSDHIQESYGHSTLGTQLSRCQTVETEALSTTVPAWFLKLQLCCLLYCYGRFVACLNLDYFASGEPRYEFISTAPVRPFDLTVVSANIIVYCGGAPETQCGCCQIINVSTAAVDLRYVISKVPMLWFIHVILIMSCRW
jgi:hypothetical protein